MFSGPSITLISPPKKMPELQEESSEELVEKSVTDLYVAKKLVQLKQSADSRGIAFSLSFKTVKRLLSTKRCYYTGKLFSTGINSRSVDRLDSNLGYIEGTVVSCTIDINQKKANLTLEEIFMLSRKLKFVKKSKTLKK